MMRRPLFHRAYGEALGRLPPAIVRVHDTGNGRTWRGEANVTTGSSLLARIVRALAALPPASGTVPILIHVQPDGDGETWRREFAGHPLTTHLRAARTPGTIEEALWPVTAVLQLEPDKDWVQQVLIGLRLFGLLLPRFLWPDLDVRESAEGDRYRFRVVMKLGGVPLEAYEGWLEAPEKA